MLFIFYVLYILEEVFFRSEELINKQLQFSEHLW